MDYKYIISGGSGFIGTNLINKLEPGSFVNFDLKEGVDILGNIPRFKANTFIHLAANTSVRESVEFPRMFINDNCKGTLNCLEYARQNCKQFIFISSCGAEYSLSPYAASKRACEAFCNAYRESFDLDVMILRLSNVYGPHSINKQSLIAKAIKACIDKQDLEIYGQGSQTRDFVYVSDAVDRILECKSHRELYNICSGIQYHIIQVIIDIIELSKQLLDYSPKVSFLPFQKGEIHEVARLSGYSENEFEYDLETTFKWFIAKYGK